MNILTPKARRRKEDRIIGPSDHRATGAVLKCSGDHPITRGHPIIRSVRFHPGGAGAVVAASRRIYTFARTAGRLAAAALREIFDESAYERYLAQTASRRSVASYWAFLQERDTGIARRPRCC